MMRCTKDSFYMELRDRLAALNPARVIWINGVERPAIIVTENEIATLTESPTETIILAWENAKAVDTTEPAPLFEIACSISYCTEGTEDLNGQDRGRILAQLDEELLAITRPAKAALQDHSQTPPLGLGRTFFWSLPELKEVEVKGARLHRAAQFRIYNFVEGSW